MPLIQRDIRPVHNLNGNKSGDKQRSWSGFPCLQSPRLFRKTAVGLAAFAALPILASAQTSTFTGNGSDQWNDAANWDNGVPNGTFAEANFNSGTGGNLFLPDSSGINVEAINFTDGVSDLFLGLNPGANLNVDRISVSGVGAPDVEIVGFTDNAEILFRPPPSGAAAISVGGAEPGHLTLDGTRIDVSDRDIEVRNSGTLQITGESDLRNVFDFTLRSGGNAVVRGDGNETPVLNASLIYLNPTTNSQFSVEDGGLVSASTLRVGGGDGSTSSVFVGGQSPDGYLSRISADNFFIGEQGNPAVQADMTISFGGVVDASVLNGSGSLEIASGGTVNVLGGGVILDDLSSLKIDNGGDFNFQVGVVSLDGDQVLTGS